MKPSTWLWIGAIGLLAWLAFRDDDPAEKARPALDYNQVAVSQGMTAEAQELDLSEHLDVSLLPDIGRQAVRAAAQQGLREQAFLQFVLREVSDRVREISTIDLNADDVTDPILVKPEPREGEQFVLLSIGVPAPGAYPLPDAREQDAWKRVETIEVATMTVALDSQALTVQAQGNQHLYPNAAQQNFAVQDTTPNFLSMYLTMRMLDWMFFPPMWGFWGPGYGYGGYSPQRVPDAATRRGDAIAQRNYERSAPRGDSAIRTRAGGAPTSQYGRLYANQRPQALNQLRSSQAFRARQSAPVASGGFGRPGAGPRSPSAFSNRSPGQAPQALSSPRSFRPRLGGRPGFGGFGRGGMRFGRCHGCWRGAAPSAYITPGVIAFWPALPVR